MSVIIYYSGKFFDLKKGVEKEIEKHLIKICRYIPSGFDEIPYSRIDQAGQILVATNGTDIESNEVVSDWREIHAYPMHYIRDKILSILRELGLRNRENHGVILAQRLKRMPTILDKMSNRTRNIKKLSKMQDIGGIRVVLHKHEERFLLTRHRKNMENLSNVCDSYEKLSCLEIVKKYDYIASPKESGYRGIHFVSRVVAEEENEYFQSFQIEVQVRTYLQHLWATAVEVVGLHINKDLKSGVYDEKWTKFFQLASSIFAHEEGSPLLEAHREIPIKNIALELFQQEEMFDFLEEIPSIKEGRSDNRGGGDSNENYILVTANTETGEYTTIPYSHTDIEEANKDYFEKEMENMLENNKNYTMLTNIYGLPISCAYQNLFGDTREFQEQLERILHKILFRDSAMKIFSRCITHNKFDFEFELRYFKEMYKNLELYGCFHVEDSPTEEVNKEQLTI